MSDPHVHETPLHAGDRAELRFEGLPDFVASGVIRTDDQGCCLVLGPWPLITNGSSVLRPDMRLTVTKLAPRPQPVYTNHSREEPVDGDVVRSASTSSRTTWVRSGNQWFNTGTGKVDAPPAGVRLLVDGDTGQPVP